LGEDEIRGDYRTDVWLTSYLFLNIDFTFYDEWLEETILEFTGD